MSLEDFLAESGTLAPPAPVANPAQATPDPSPLGDWLAGSEEQQRFDASLQQGMAGDSVTAQRLIRLQTKTGLPRDFLARNLDTVEHDLKQAGFDPVKYRQSSPAVAAWIAEHPDHAAAAKDELQQLNYWERQWRYITDARERSTLTVELADLGGAAWNGTLTPEQRARQQQIEQRLQTRPDLNITGFVEQIPGAVAEQSEIFLRSLGGKVQHGAEGGVIGAAAGAVAGAATANPALPAAGFTLGVLSGWRYGAAIEAGKLEMNLAYLDYEKLKDDAGHPLDRETIRGLSGMVGVINGALEGMTGVEALANKLPGIRSLSRNGLKELLKTPTMRAAVLSYAKNVGQTMATEGVTEALQFYITQAGGVMAKALKDGGTPGEWLATLFSPQNQAQAIQEARAGAQGGGGMAVALGAPGLVADFQRAKEAKATANAMRSLGDSSADLTVRQNMPGTLRRILEQATQDGPITELYMPVDSFNKYFQSMGADPRDVAKAVTGNVEAYDLAMRTGQDFPIKLSDYAEHLAGTEHNTVLSQELRPSLDAMNAREADEWLKARTEEEQAQQQGVQTQSANDPLAKVRQDIAGQLGALGFDPGVVDQYAALFEARYRARAERRGLGEDPFQLFQRLGLTVQRALPDILKNLGQKTSELDALLNRLRSGDVPKDREIYGKSLFDVLIEKGGVQDQGGELSTLGVDDGRKRFTKKLANKKGLTLDQAAEAMFEAGYLDAPEINGLLEAIGREAGGKPVFLPGGENARLFDVAQTLEDLRRYLQDLGVDLNTASNEAITDLLKNSQPGSVAGNALAGERLNQTVPLESHVDGPGFRAKQLADIFKGHPLGTEGDGSFGVPSLAAMFAQVRRAALADPKVLDAIVGSVPVDVVNDLFGSEAAAKTALHNEPMFKDRSAFNTDLSIAQAIDASSPISLLIQEAARLATKFEGVAVSSGGETVEGGETPHAGKESVFYQGEPPKEKILASIDLSTNTITLLEGANLSSFLHETGHLYLNELIDDATTASVPQQLKDDLDAILHWMNLDVRTADGADAIKAAIQTEHHEQFARGFEAYTLEGKSPSHAMREVFFRFRQWLIQVYRIMTFRGGATPESIGRALNVTLTNEVRRVMNRMVATEEEIEAMEAEADVLPMFTDAAAAGMSEREFANYKDLVGKASMTAREKLQTQVMAQLARERQAWWVEQREQVKEQVTAETNQHKDYIALSVLQKGIMPDGSALPEGISAAKLDRAAVIQIFGKDFLKQLPRGVLTKSGGIAPEQAAQIFGYESAQDLLTSLANARPKKALIEAETDHRMTREYGDPLIDGTLHDKARAAVLNEDREQVVEAELRALRKKQREVAPFVKAATEEATEQRKTQLSKFLLPPMDTIRDLARDTIRRTKVKEIKPYQYFLAAQKASRKSLDAHRGAKYPEAMDWKHKELLNLSLYREATAAVEEANRIAEHMRELRKKPAQQRLGKAGADYLEQVNALMERYEFTPIPLLDLDKRETLREWIAKKQANGETLGEEFSIPDNILLEARRMNFKELPYEELLGVRDTIQQIEHFAALKNKLLSKQAAADKGEARDALLAHLAANVTRLPPGPITKAGLTGRERVSKWVREMDASLLKMETVVEWLDGGQTGPWHDYLWNPAADAQHTENDYTATVTAKIAKAVLSMPIEIRKKMLDTVDVGTAQRMTRKDLLGVALNVGNQSNYDKLLKGMSWSPDQVTRMLNELTKDEWDFVQSIWDTLESMRPDIGTLQKELTGIEPEWIDPKPVKTKFGEYKGGYYPVMYSRVLSEQGGLQMGASIGQLTDPQYVRATLPSGHRKARAEGFARPFDLDLDRLPTHIAGVIHDLSHRRWLIDANWITNDPKIRAALTEHVGDALTLQIADWVKQVANDRNAPAAASMSGWRRMIETFRFNTVVVAMGFKASTMLSQLAGLPASIETLGGKDGGGVRWLTAGMAETFRRPRTTYEFMIEKSGEMRHRLQTRDRDMRQKLLELEGKTDILSQVQSASLMGIGYMELMVSMPTWMGGYKKALHEGQSEEQAIRAGDRAVRLSQGSGAAKDLAAVATHSELYMRLLTMFYTPFSALYNRMRSIGHDTEGMKDAPRSAMRMFWTVIVAATLGELLSGHGPDDDEEWPVWWAEHVALYPFLSVPMLRDATSTIVSGYGYQFSPIGQALETGTRLVSGTGKAIAGEKEWEELAPQAVKAFSYLVGAPTSQLMITGTYLQDLATGDADPDDLLQFAHDLIYKRKEK